MQNSQFSYGSNDRGHTVQGLLVCVDIGIVRVRVRTRINTSEPIRVSLSHILRPSRTCPTAVCDRETLMGSPVLIQVFTFTRTIPMSTTYVKTGIKSMTNKIEEIELDTDILTFESNEETDFLVRVTPSQSYNQFFSNYLGCNKPCVIGPDVTKDWQCRQDWKSNDGAPNFKLLKGLFGNTVAPVADCGRKYYNSQVKDDMTIREYLDYWIEYRKLDYSSDKPLLYLKDWHCIKENRNVPIYEVPQYVASDWLNEYYIGHPNLDDDYMFVYMGPKGTWTPLHVDVFTSYSWSANVIGKKRWLLYPPGEENQFRDTHGELTYDTTSEELHNSSKYKSYNSNSLQCLEIIQEIGEIVFVPSGWYHQVWNLEDTISINHNWINGCNIWNTWLALKREMVAVTKEISDCKDMDNWIEKCQFVLQASHEKEPVVCFGKWVLGFNHCLFDIQRVKNVLLDFIKNAEEESVYNLICPHDEAHDLLDKISSVLDFSVHMY